MPRGVGRLAIDVVVGRHHRACVGLLHDHLEGQQEGVVQFAPAEVHGGVVAPALAGGMSGVVLQRRQHVAARPLQAAHVAGAEHAHQIGVFAEGFFGAAPAHVTRNVQHRGQALMAAQRQALGPYLLRGALHQRGVPGRAKGQRRGEQRAVTRHQAHQALLVRYRRNAQTCLVLEKALEVVERAFARASFDAMGAQGTCHLAQTGAQELPPIDRAVTAWCLIFGAKLVVAGVRQDHPGAVHLRHLFVERHALEQIPHARSRRLPGVFVEALRGWCHVKSSRLHEALDVSLSNS